MWQELSPCDEHQETLRHREGIVLSEEQDGASGD